MKARGNQRPTMTYNKSTPPLTEEQITRFDTHGYLVIDLGLEEGFIETLNYSGTVLQSTGKYEPTSWYIILLKKEEEGYIAYDWNGFNVRYITFDEMDGYCVIPPLCIFKSLEEYAHDLKEALRRWT